MARLASYVSRSRKSKSRSSNDSSRLSKGASFSRPISGNTDAYRKLNGSGQQPLRLRNDTTIGGDESYHAGVGRGSIPESDCETEGPIFKNGVSVQRSVAVDNYALEELH